MPKQNKILSFLAVSFVLVFMGKISKVSLFSAYFKTISEYEIRNSVDLDQRLITHQISDLVDLPGLIQGQELPLLFALVQTIDLFPAPTVLQSIEAPSSPVKPGRLAFSPSTPIRGPDRA